MGLLSAISDVLEASTQSTSRGDVTQNDSEGAYWCHDCEERIRDVAVESETAPDCPGCGDTMSFERSKNTTGCAC
jgi:Zn finger protein HypA/HybF involved in hydrogenase expression